MNDITALAQREMEQREKFEAWTEESCALPWGYLKKRRTYDGFYSEHTYTSLWAAWKAASMALVEALENAQAINAAAEKLVRCKGRYHSEQNYRALAALFGVNTPDLPPLDGESQPVTVKLPSGTGWASDPYNHGRNDGISECAKELRAAGINVEAE